MKNFTNNFKQFTSRLSARWLIMALMMLVGTSSAWAQTWCLAGRFNGWSDAKLSSGKLTVTISSIGEYTFKIKKQGTWEGAYSVDGSRMERNNCSDWQLYTDKGDSKFYADVVGDYTFTFNSTNKTLSITYPPQCATCCNDNYVAGNTELTGYNWDPGQNKMTCSNNLYSITFTNVKAGTHQFKITNGSWGWSTDNITAKSGSNYLSLSKDGGNIQFTTSSIYNITIYFDGNGCYATFESACIPPAAPTLNPNSTTVCSETSFKLPSGYRWYTVQTDGTKLSSNTISAGITQETIYYAEAGEDGCVSTSRTAYTVNVDAKPALTLKSNPTICQGDQITLSEYVSSSSGTVKWYSNSDRTTEIQNLLVTPSPGTTPYYARATNGVCSAVDKSLTVTVRATPTKFDVTVGSADNKVKLSNSQTNYTYTLYNAKGEKVGNSITGTTGTPLQWTVSEAGTYKVKAKYTGSTCAETEMNGSYTYTPCTPANVQITSGPSDICPGGSTTFTYTAAAGANITWRMGSASSAFAFSENNGTVTVRHSNPATIVGGANKILYTVTDANNICPASDVDTEKTITLLSVPSISASTSTTQNICYGTKATLTVTRDQGTYTWENSNGGEAIDSKTNSVTVSKAGTYTVTAQNAGGCTSNKITFTVTVKDPVAAPALNPKSATVCGGEPFKLQNIDGVTWSLDGKPTTGSQPGIANNTDAAITKTFQAVKEVDGCPSAPADYKVTVNPTPVITGESVAQPGKKNAITLKLQGTLEATWKISGGDIDKTQGNSIQFSAETNGTYTITATTKEDCSATHEVTVADAFYVYMRQPKKGETAYNNFYFPTQNPTQGGDLFYKEYASIPPAEGYTDYNTGGVAHDIIFTDCDGYVWYGFKASDKLVDGTNYFTVRAPNEGGNGGYYTHTYLTKPGAMTSDIYYTMNENESGSSRGWYITKVSAPYAGPKVHASGSTALGTNKFAALYVTDCSGKEITGYQWYKDGQPYSSVCSYVGKNGSEDSNAGETNNIRPDVAGNYSCTVKYEDGSTVTSEPVQVTGTYTHASSTLPVIIVNTNGVGFPVNNTCQTPSAHADDMKEKVSVDVKIYDGSTMVYDRKARMNYRGSSSLNFLKKSYAFCPGKDNCVEDKGRLDYVKTEKMNMLGIGTAKDKDWVLYAAAADPSLMRNRLMFDTFRDMTGGWSVNSRYVELYVDGEYKGVYVMMDKVTKNEGRVNITDPNGFIVKFDKTDLVDRYEADGDKKTFKSLYSGYDGESGNGMGTYDTFIDQRFEIEYPEMEDVEEDNPGMWAKTVNDIKTLFNNFESNLKAGNYAEVQKIIDYISWADWFIISEYAKNMDAYRASCLFVYNGGKIEARPLWDQELSFNNQCANLCSTYGCNSTTGLLIENSKIYEEGCAAPFWFTGKYVGGRGTEAKSGAQFEGYLLNDPCFIAVLKERWALHTATGGALTQDVMNAKISGYEKDLGSVGTSGTPLYRERNTYWSGKSRKTIDKANSGGTCFTGETGYQDTEISTSISAMKSWITGNRRTNLGTLITDMEGSPLSISFMPQQVTTTPWEPITLQVVNTSSYDYTITYTDVELDKQSGVIINKTDDTFKINVPRPDNWGIGNEQEEGKRADITYGIKATLNVAGGTTVCGKSEVTPATATIILQDEPNEDCDNN